VVQMLIRRKAAIDVQNHDGDTALLAASRAGSTASARLLRAAGASTSLRNGKRASAADIARDRGFTGLAAELESK